MKDTMSVVKERYPGIAKRREAVAESGGLVELPDDFDADGMGLAAGTARLRGLDTYGTRAPAAPSAQPRRGGANQGAPYVSLRLPGMGTPRPLPVVHELAMRNQLHDIHQDLDDLEHTDGWTRWDVTDEHWLYLWDTHTDTTTDTHR